MALQKVEAAGHADFAPEKGIILYSKDGALISDAAQADTLGVDLNPRLWNLTDDPSLGDISGRKVKVEGFVTALNEYFQPVQASNAPNKFLSALKSLYGPDADAGGVNRMDFALGQGPLDLRLAPRVSTPSASSYDPGAASFFAATDGADRIVGTYENNIVVGGDGNDEIYGGYGKDILLGGLGDDTFVDNVSERVDALANVSQINDDIYIGGATMVGWPTHFLQWLLGLSETNSVRYSVQSDPDDRNTLGTTGVEVVSLGSDKLADADVVKIRIKDKNTGQTGTDTLVNIEKVVLSERGDTLDVSDDMLKTSVWIDMGEASGESFGKSDYDKLSFQGLSEGVVLVNGATQNGPANGPMAGGLSSLSMLASLIFDVPPSAAAVLGGVITNNPLRVTRVEDITLTDKDDVVWSNDFGRLGSFLTGWPEGSDYPKYGEIHAGGGHDVVYVKGTEYVRAGEKVGPAPAAGQEDTRPTASQELRLTVYGDEGEDRLIARGGEGAILVGGADRDFLYNTSWKGQLYGDSIDGTGARSTDVFWWSAGSFIMDAGREDILQFFGLPLTGGTNTIAGLPSGQTKWACDRVLPFVRYGLSDSNQLIVQSWLGNIVDHKLRTSPSDEILKSSMIVENYHFGEGGNWAHPARDDLNMTFRIVTRDDGPNAMNGFYSVWGALIAELDALLNFAKMLKWKTPDDPLVLDLDGDGIETTSKDQGGVHFDMNGDHFAELNGWVGADDGLLIMDRDGNGRIDDVSELFGRPAGRLGFGSCGEEQEKFSERTLRNPRRKSKSRYRDRWNVQGRGGQRTKIARNQPLTTVKVSLICNSRKG